MLGNLDRDTPGHLDHWGQAYFKQTLQNMEKTIYSLSTGENIAERAGRARSALAAQTFDCCHEGTRRRLGYVANASKEDDNADLEEKLHNIRKDLVSEFLEQNQEFDKLTSTILHYF